MLRTSREAIVRFVVPAGKIPARKTASSFAPAVKLHFVVRVVRLRFRSPKTTRGATIPAACVQPTRLSRQLPSVSAITCLTVLYDGRCVPSIRSSPLCQRESIGSSRSRKKLSELTVGSHSAAVIASP